MNESTLVARHVEEFDQAWRKYEAGAKMPSIDMHLASVVECGKSELLHDLIQADVWWRGKWDSMLPKESYLSAYPQHLSVVKSALARAASTDLIGAATSKPQGEKHPSPASKEREETVGNGRYGLIRKIGRGGMSDVYTARDHENKDCLVAIKKMRYLPSADAEEMIGRFEKEADVLTRLDDQSIVKSRHQFVEGSDWFIVMDFVPGMTLADVVKTHGPLGNEVAAEQVKRITHAMHKAHKKNILHRDLKPGNVMMRPRDKDAHDPSATPVADPEAYLPVIIDFGLAKLIDGAAALTTSDMALGTPEYMPPEQFTAIAEVDNRADVYGIGAILYHTLTGRHPFECSTPNLPRHQAWDEIRGQVLEKAPESPRKFNSQAARELETICMKCLEKEPRHRYQSAGDLAEDLQRYLDGIPIKAIEISLPNRAYRWCRRNRLLTSIFALLSLLVVVLSGGGVGLALAFDHARRSATREEAANEDLRHLLYAAEMSLADEAIANGRVARARQYLRRQIGSGKDLRGFEWFYLWRKCHQETMRYAGHRDGVRSLAISPDGITLATSGVDGEIRLWDADSGDSQHVLKGHRDEVNCVRFSPNGRWLASASDDMSVILWDANTGQPTTKFTDHTRPIHGLAFSPDGELLVTVGGKLSEDFGEVKVWDLVGNRPVRNLPGHQGGVTLVKFSPDGKLLATAEEGSLDPRKAGGKVVVWDTSTFQRKSFMQAQTFKLLGLAFLPDNRLVTGGMENDGHGSLMFWDASSGKHLDQVDPDRIPLELAVSPDGATLAFGSDRDVVFWDIAASKAQRSFVAHEGLVRSLEFQPNGRSIFTAAISGDSVAKAWETEPTSNPKKIDGHTGWVNCLAISQDGRQLASASRSTTPDGVAEIILRDSASGEMNLQIPAATTSVNALAFAPDGLTLSAACDDGTIKIWNTTTGELLDTLRGHDLPVTHLLFSHDGKMLASADGFFFRFARDGAYAETYEHPGRILLWNFEQRRLQQELCRHASAAVMALGGRPNGRALVAGFRNGSVQEYDWESTKLIRELTPFRKIVTQVAYSPDGALLAVGGQDGGPDESGIVRLIETDSGFVQVEMVGHSAAIGQLVFSPDGRTLASGSWDKTIRFWDPRDGHERLVLRSGSVSAMAFSPSSRDLFVGTTAKQLEIWHAATDVETARTLGDAP